MMGLHNAFYRKNLLFNSEEALRFGEEWAEMISSEPTKESCEFAKKYGGY
jgi:ribonucleotide reductase alpha subunit